MERCLEPLIELTRGSLRESVHCGAIAVVDSAGHTIASIGDIDSPVYMRSAAKPLQALPVITSGAAETFKVTDQELAIIAASHTGEDTHVSVVQGLLDKVGLTESDLLCGYHPPMDRKTAQRLVQQGAPPSQLRNNCSGKHTGMLALAKQLWNGATSDGVHSYLDLSGAVQQRMLSAVSAFSKVSANEMIVAIDGCSAPNFALSLRAAALAGARFADPSALSAEYQEAARRVFLAMTSFPELVQGKEKFDCELMRHYKGALVSKGGAEGYQLAAIRPIDGATSQALGVALKIADGDLRVQAAPMALLSALDQLHLFDSSTTSILGKWRQGMRRNHRDLVIGEVRPCFRLNFAAHGR